MHIAVIKLAISLFKFKKNLLSPLQITISLFFILSLTACYIKKIVYYTRLWADVNGQIFETQKYTTRIWKKNITPGSQ